MDMEKVLGKTDLETEWDETGEKLQNQVNTLYKDIIVYLLRSKGMWVKNFKST